MDIKPQIMPFRIMVAAYNPFSTRYYNKKGEALYHMGNDYPRGRYIEFTHDLLLRILSIRSIDEAATFFSDYPQLRFVFYDNTVAANHSSLAEYDTLDQYNRLVNNTVRLCNNIFEIPRLIGQQGVSPTIARRKRIETIYRNVFPFVIDRKHSWESFLDMKNDFLDQFASEVMDDGNTDSYCVPCDDAVNSTKYELDDQMPITAFFTEEEINQKKHKTVVDPLMLRLEKAVDTMMSSMIEKFISNNLGRAEICYDSADRVLDCRCPDLLCAMCMMYYVAQHNEVEYRECSTPGCHQMFIAEPPSRRHCDKHIAVLRRKRANQKAAKEAYNKSIENKQITQLYEILEDLIDRSEMVDVVDNPNRFVVRTQNGSSFTITIQKD